MAGIRSWSVRDFKSLAVADLQQRRLTVLTGANSSGKSSVLQALLMLGQSVNRGGGMVLNGPLVRLGLPKDVVKNGQTAVQFDFQIDVGDPAAAVGPVNLAIRVALEPSDDGVSLEPTSVEISDRNSGALLLSATSERRGSEDHKLIKKYFDGEVTPLRVTVIEGRRAPSRTYVSMLGVIPISISRHRSAKHIHDQFEQLIAVRDVRDRLPYESVLELSRLVKKSDLKIAIKDLSPSARFTSKDISTLDRDAFDQLVAIAAEKRARNEWVHVEPQSRSAFGTRYSEMEGVVESALAIEFETTLSLLAAIGESIRRHGSAVKYLGPLRDEPRVVHGAWDESMRSLPVGIRGELTAEVLTRRRDERIVFFDPDGKSRFRSLPGAVAEWCDYLGIGDHIKILDLGKLGRGVELRVNGVHRDLTTIGVGASQLLPVIVAGLSVPSQTLLLVEQPELHLHPQVQSRLADFFLFARRDVRWIIETHSEYLVTRIRRRVAEEKAEKNAVQVLFAEQKNGSTEIEKLALSEYGDFARWPQGFFDAQDLDIARIVDAVVEKAKRSSNDASSTN